MSIFALAVELYGTFGTVEIFEGLHLERVEKNETQREFGVGDRA